MRNQKATGRLGEREHKAYVDVVNLIIDELKKLLVDFSMNTTYLRWPDQSFSVQKGLVQPWNQLQLAQSNMSEFFPDGSASQAFDLAPKMAEALQTFEQVWRDEVAKYARMWSMVQYGDAEGNPSRGLMRLSILVRHQGGKGGELGARQASLRRGAQAAARRARADPYAATGAAASLHDGGRRQLRRARAHHRTYFEAYNQIIAMLAVDDRARQSTTRQPTSTMRSSH